MVNDVASAKLRMDPKYFCTLSDIDVTESNIQVTSTVYDDGDSADVKDTYYGDIDKGYYSCNSCGGCLPWTAANRLEVWKKVKEHLNG